MGAIFFLFGGHSAGTVAASPAWVGLVAAVIAVAGAVISSREKHRAQRNG